MRLDFSPVLVYSSSLLLGAGVTLLITVAATVISVAGGLLVAVFALFGNKLLSLPMRFFIWLFMGTPLLLQLYFLYFGFGQVNIIIPALLTGIIGLGIHYAAYNADIFRAAMQSIGTGQYEVSRSLGFGHLRTMFHVIIPQAVIRVIPQIGNNVIIMFKDTSILAVIGVSELVLAAQYAISVTFRPFELYVAAAMVYYVFSLGFEFSLGRFEQKMMPRR